MSRIHPTAIVDAGAELDTDVEVGPYAIVGPNVCVGAGSRIEAHAVLDGKTTLGRNNHVFSFAVVGSIPQDKKFHGEDVVLEIGDNNIIREFTTLNPGTANGGGRTAIGNGNLLMAYVHIAHDCIVGNHCVLANSAQLAGHVVLEDHVIFGGMSGIHQFARVGTGAMVGGGSMVTLDVPPFCIVAGNRASLHGLNTVGLKRSGLPDAQLQDLKQAYRVLFRQNRKLADALAELREQYPETDAPARILTEFVANSSRGVCRPERERS